MKIQRKKAVGGKEREKKSKSVKRKRKKKKKIEGRKKKENFSYLKCFQPNCEKDFCLLINCLKP